MVKKLVRKKIVKKPPAQERFLTINQVIQKAANIGFLVRAARLREAAKEGKIPSTKKQLGHGMQFVFPESKLRKILTTVPKTMPLSNGAVTIPDLIKTAEKQGLVLHETGIRSRIASIEKGVRPIANGLARALWLRKNPHALPRAFADQLLSEAKLSKELPGFLDMGAVIQLEHLERELGLERGKLLYRKDIYRFRIGLKGGGTGTFVTAEEAKSFKDYYLIHKKGKNSIVKPRAETTKPRGQLARLITRAGARERYGEKTPVPQWVLLTEKIVAQNRQIAKDWLKASKNPARDWYTKAHLRTAIEVNIGLSPQNFEELVIPKLRQILEKQGKL